MKHILNSNNIITLYYSLIYPYIDYANSLWGTTHSTHINIIYIKQKNAIRIVTKASFNTHTSPLFKKLNILKQHDVYILQVTKYIYTPPPNKKTFLTQSHKSVHLMIIYIPMTPEAKVNLK